MMIRPTTNRMGWLVASLILMAGVASGQTATETAATDNPIDSKTGAAHAEAAPANEFPGEKSDIQGFSRYQVKTGKGTISVVCPKKAAPGKPWMWRSMFWGIGSEATKRVARGDLKLVEQGYYVVIAPGDVAGHPRGNALIDAAYQTLTQEYGFSQTLSMGSMSRENLALFRWASANPEKVESIYVDNGVCNVKSWPGGKLVLGSDSVADGDPRSWTGMKNAYGFVTDEELLVAKVSPIDLLEPLSKAGVPILMVCGTRDTTVPYEENGAIMKERYEELGGDIKIIFEDKGHHPHGMADPAPVVDFIQKAHLKTQYDGVANSYPSDSKNSLPILQNENE